MTAPELQVLVVADLARAPHVAAVPGLPELLAEDSVRRVLAGEIYGLEDLALGAPIPAAAPGICASASDSWHITAAHGLARYLASLGWRETRLGHYCAKDGSGDGGHGWGWLQRDNRTPVGAADCARIQAVVPFSPDWWRVSLEVCAPVAIEALHEYPGNVEAAACRYNASRVLVDRGIAEGDPNKYTTKGVSGEHDYGRDVLATVKAWWPE